MNGMLGPALGPLNDVLQPSDSTPPEIIATLVEGPAEWNSNVWLWHTVYVVGDRYEQSSGRSTLMALQEGSTVVGLMRETPTRIRVREWGDPLDEAIVTPQEAAA